MPLEYVFLLPQPFSSVQTTQKSDDAQLVRKPYICNNDILGSAVAVLLRAYEEPMKHARTKNRNFISLV